MRTSRSASNIHARVFEAEHLDIERAAGQEEDVGLIEERQSVEDAQNEAEAPTELDERVSKRQIEGKDKAQCRASGRGERTSQQGHQAG